MYHEHLFAVKSSFGGMPVELADRRLGISRTQRAALRRLGRKTGAGSGDGVRSRVGAGVTDGGVVAGVSPGRVALGVALAGRVDDGVGVALVAAALGLGVVEGGGVIEGVKPGGMGVLVGKSNVGVAEGVGCGASFRVRRQMPASPAAA